MRWKWIIGISLTVIVAVVVAAFIVIASYDFNELKPTITELAKQYTGRDLTLGGDIELGLSLVPTLVVSEVAFQNASWGSRPQLATVKRLEVQVALIPLLKGEINISRLKVVNPELLIEVDKTGKSNLEFDTPEMPKPNTAAENDVDADYDFLKFKEMYIEAGLVTYHDHKQGRTETIFIESLKFATPEFGAPADINLKFTYNEALFKMAGVLGQLSGILNPNEPWPLNLTITAFDSTISIAGQITNMMEFKGIDLKLTANGPDITNFQPLTEKALPVKGPFDVAGHVTAQEIENIKIHNIEVLLGESKISGEMAFNQKSPQPQINAKFHSALLDLRPFLKTNESGRDSNPKTRKTKTRSDKVFSSEPLDLQALQLVDAKVNFQADQILAHQIALDKFQMELSLVKGRLIIEPLSANIGGGNFYSSLDLLAKKNSASLTTKMQARKIDFGEMLKKLDINQDLEGILEAKMNFKGQGRSVADLMAGLDGNVIVFLNEVKMPASYIELVGADMTTTLMKLVNPFENKVDRATINCVVCDFNIKGGLAKSDIIMVDDPEKTLLSSGTINLKTETLEFGIQTKPKEGIGTKETGKISVSLSELTKPFKLEGTLANPSLGFSTTEAAKTVGLTLLTPSGWAALIKYDSSGEENPCVAALKVAGEGPAKKTTKSDKKQAQRESGNKKEGGLGSKVMKLFSGE